VKTNRDSTTLSVTSEITYLTVKLTESPDQRDVGKNGRIAIVREVLYVLPFGSKIAPKRIFIGWE
jgi:hypothetical protein